MPQINEISWFLSIMLLFVSFFTLMMIISSMKLDFSFNFSKKHIIFYYSVLV